MFLELRHVSRTFRLDGVEIKALENISLRIKRGEFVSIMGPSGSGKSTLMYLVGCLDKPTDGEVIFERQKVSDLSDVELAKIRNQKIGFVFQMFNLLPRTTALGNVELPLIYAGLPTERRKQMAIEKLESLGLEKRIYHFPNQLSGGEQQRVAIARALVTSPSLILADEPTGNIDTKTGKEILQIFKGLNKKGHTIVVVTHDLEVARFTQRIIKIKDGRTVGDF